MTTKRVLIVDGDEEIRDLISEALIGCGYTPFIANGFGDAIALGWRHRFDLLITSVVLDRFSGLDLAADLRQVRPDLKVIYMSGIKDPVRVNSSLHPGSDALLKPFTERELVEKATALVQPRSRRLGGVSSESGCRMAYGG